MQSQLDLLDPPPAIGRNWGLPPLPRAARTDPVTSQDSADHVTKTGLAKYQALLCQAAITSHPGHTSQELCELTGLDRYMLARRLPELRAAGKARTDGHRTCSVTRRNAMTWWPT
jgi:hypothetical protein